MSDTQKRLKKEIEEDFKIWWDGNGGVPILEEMIIATVDRVFRMDEEEKEVTE